MSQVKEKSDCVKLKVWQSWIKFKAQYPSPEGLHLSASRPVDHQQPVGVLLQIVQHPELPHHHHNYGCDVHQDKTLHDEKKTL